MGDSSLTHLMPQRKRDSLDTLQSSLPSLAENSPYGRITSVTFASQLDLPRLPIPSLDETLNKFLHRVECLQDEEQIMETRRIVLEFLKGDGPKLQELLLEYDRIGEQSGALGSYVEQFWNDSYLVPDPSLVLNLNPYFILDDGPDPAIAKDQLRRAASLCFAGIKMACQLRNEVLLPDIFKGRPLCMDQFKALFGAARVPHRTEKDYIDVYPESSHVVVMSRNQMYYFQVLWPDGDLAVDEEDIIDILEAIRRNSQAADPLTTYKSALGVLTSMTRSEWAAAREDLAESGQKNLEYLTIIDSALFVLVLDDYKPPDLEAMVANMLHGSYEVQRDEATFTDYQVGTCCNRWYDKLQIIVCADGTAGINFEHTAIDGHTALRFVADIYAETVVSFAQNITKTVQAHGEIPSVVHGEVKRAALALDNYGRPLLDVIPKKIAFEISPHIEKMIYFAETNLTDQIIACDTHVLEFKDYGKLLIVANNLSPDAYVQMSIMLAHCRVYGKFVDVYEPVLTKAFYHGRTEAMRSATPEAKELCEVWFDPDSPDQLKLATLRKATQAHSQYVKECSRGKGMDRHLFALKCIAELHNLPTSSFFNSEPWRLLNHSILATANCGNPSIRFHGFGPHVPDGLGIGYIIKDTSIHYTVTSKHRQTKRFLFGLEGTLKQMRTLLKRSVQSVASSQHRRSLKHIPFLVRKGEKGLRVDDPPIEVLNHGIHNEEEEEEDDDVVDDNIVHHHQHHQMHQQELRQHHDYERHHHDERDQKFHQLEEHSPHPNYHEIHQQKQQQHQHQLQQQRHEHLQQQQFHNLPIHDDNPHSHHTGRTTMIDDESRRWEQSDHNREHLNSDDSKRKSLEPARSEHSLEHPDLMPQVPTRRGSYFYGHSRRNSLSFRELSQSGVSLVLSDDEDVDDDDDDDDDEDVDDDVKLVDDDDDDGDGGNDEDDDDNVQNDNNGDAGGGDDNKDNNNKNNNNNTNEEQDGSMKSPKGKKQRRRKLKDEVLKEKQEQQEQLEDSEIFESQVIDASLGIIPRVSLKES